MGRTGILVAASVGLLFTGTSLGRSAYKQMEEEIIQFTWYPSYWRVLWEMARKDLYLSLMYLFIFLPAYFLGEKTYFWAGVIAWFGGLIPGCIGGILALRRARQQRFS